MTLCKFQRSAYTSEAHRILIPRNFIPLITYMSDNFISIGDHIAAREDALNAAFSDKSLISSTSWKLPHFLRRKTSSLFRQAHTRRHRWRLRLSKFKKPENARMRTFYSKRYQMKSIKNIFQGVVDEVPFAHTKKSLRFIDLCLRGGVVLYDVSPFLSSIDLYQDLKWCRELIEFRKKVHDLGGYEDGFFIEVLSLSEISLENLMAQLKKNVAGSREIIIEKPSVQRYFLCVPRPVALHVLHKAYENHFGIRCTLVGYSERRWISLSMKETFDPRDMHATHFCVALGKGMPSSCLPIHVQLSSPRTTENGEVCVPVLKKVGIVTYGAYHTCLGRGAAFVNFRLKSYSTANTIYIRGKPYSCYPLRNGLPSE